MKKKAVIKLTIDNELVMDWILMVSSLKKAREIVRNHVENLLWDCEWSIAFDGKVEKGKMTINEQGRTLWNQW